MCCRQVFLFSSPYEVCHVSQEKASTQQWLHQMSGQAGFIKEMLLKRKTECDKIWKSRHGRNNQQHKSDLRGNKRVIECQNEL